MTTKLFGLDICFKSTDEASDCHPSDITVHLGNLGPFADEIDAPTRRLLLGELLPGADPPERQVFQLPSGAFFYHYRDDSRFVIDPSLRKVFGSWPDHITRDEALVYVLGPVLGFLLHRRGIVCLHGSAMDIDGQAAVFMGPPGAGKSTLAAAFARAGWPVLTDDVAVLADGGASFQVHPGRPRILLWPGSVEALWGDPEHLPLIMPGWTKRYLNLAHPDYCYGRRPLPLGSVYLLGERQPTLTGPVFQSLTGAAVLFQLAANTYGNNTLTPELRASEFEVLSRILRHVRVRQVTLPDDPGRLGDAVNGIVADCRASLPANIPSPIGA